MIKAIVLDIDGVIIGSKKGVNFPHPSKKVQKALQKIHDSGILVSFLTAKPTFAAAENIKGAGIDNPHIADGGATIFNPLQEKIIHSVAFDSRDIVHLLQLLPKNTYINPFSVKQYYLQKSLKNDFTNRYGKFIGSFPVLVDSLEEVIKDEIITKINIPALAEKDQEIFTNAVKNSSKFSYNWSTNPNLTPTQVMVLTPKGVSKRSGVEYLAKYLNVSLDEVLGVGDTIHDWDFIKICGYKAAMGNATVELREKINHNDEHQIIGGHVNEDGLIDVLKYFKLL